MRISLLLFVFLLASCGGQETNTINETDKADQDKSVPVKEEPATDDKTVSDQPFCQIQKIFDDNCLKCHSEGGNKPTLTINKTTTDLVDKKNSKNEFYVKSGSPEESELYLRISHSEASRRMPKGAPSLSQEDIALVKSWIEDGASTNCP